MCYCSVTFCLASNLFLFFVSLQVMFNHDTISHYLAALCWFCYWSLSCLLVFIVLNYTLSSIRREHKQRSKNGNKSAKTGTDYSKQTSVHSGDKSFPRCIIQPETLKQSTAVPCRRFIIRSQVLYLINLIQNPNY